MPKNKDLKRLIRARAQKTGESYTTARARLLEKQAADDEASSVDLAARAGYSDEVVQKRTGLDWASWVERLDALGAASMSHRDIARSVGEQFEISGWWAQSVTVGYERIKGLRDLGQRRGGHYDANKSKTFPVPVSRLFRAFTVARTRNRWLPGIEWAVRTSQRDKSIRVDWPDGTRVQFYFTAKGDQKSSVAIQQGGLGSKEDVARSKEAWAERLTALAGVLAPAS